MHFIELRCVFIFVNSFLKFNINMGVLAHPQQSTGNTCLVAPLVLSTMLFVYRRVSLTVLINVVGNSESCSDPV